MIPMSPGQMLDCILPSVMEAGATISSCLRNRTHNQSVHGVERSWHLVGLGWDFTKFFSPESKDQFVWRMNAMGFQVVVKSDHVHVEPY